MRYGRKKSWIGSAGLFIILALAILILPGERRSTAIEIGVPDDSASYIFRYLIDEQALKGQVNTMLDVYPIKDCCTSTSEWALSTDNLEMAVICPDAAQRLVEKDQRYIIVGDCRVNSDILLLANASEPKIIGITQNRFYQEALAREYFGSGIEVHPILGSALPYALNTGRIDGAVMDVAAALRLEGRIISLNGSKDTVSYVLVVRKEFLSQYAFKEFIVKYNQAVQDLQDEQSMQRVIEKYAGYSCSGKEASEWKRLNVRNLSLTIPAIK